MSLLDFLKKMMNPIQPTTLPVTKAPIDDTHLTWQKGEIKQLNAFFRTTEFECHCNECSTQVLSKELLEKLTFIRDMTKIPISIHSGYRCSAYQKKLKEQGYETAVGVSQHELGNAADVSPIPLDKMLEFSIMVEKEFMAIGTGRTFLHVDTRKDKIRRWTYGSY